MKTIYLLIVLLPCIGSIISGLFCRKISNKAAHTITIALVIIAALLSIYVFYVHAIQGELPFNEDIYTWMTAGKYSVSVGFLVDNLTAMMMLVVTSVSLMVHIYSVGYMQGDPGYNRFFSYISLFTFSMLMLVMSNNFMQLFFGWEAVGLVSYLLIGFWFKRPTAIYANMKAFLVNRVGDFGFLIGIACVVYMSGQLNYSGFFAELESNQEMKAMTLHFLGSDWSILTFAAVFLFIGAMGKSAQVPLHVWLPDSMEGPTPISALIHAATMVTAGIFMVSRMSPLFELSETALSFILIIGATTALSMGVLGVFQNDIKRVIAYSTISQLGYMTVALGISAYSYAGYHLMTHAFFKALLFLGAGSVIIGMHHQQDMRFMGGLRKYMPITWITTLLGSLALVGFPLFSGYYSKEAIVMTVAQSDQFGATFAYYALTVGVFLTAFYTFRMYFMVFHGRERFLIDPNNRSHKEGILNETPKESPWTVTIPLIALAIPSVFIGLLTANWFLRDDFFQGAITIINDQNVGIVHNAVEKFITENYKTMTNMTMHAFSSVQFWLTVIGIFLAWFIFCVKPQIEEVSLRFLRNIKLLPLFENKYYFDSFNQSILANGILKIGRFFWVKIDELIIDQGIVFGAARMTLVFGGFVRKLQTGYLYHYAFLMVVGLLVLMTWVFFN